MSMDKSAADSYVYAKASGMLAKSYVGERSSVLFSQRSLSELWSLLFKKEAPVVPEALFASELQKEAFGAFLSQFKSLLECYPKPDAILTSLIQSYEYENFKDLLISTRNSIGEGISFQDITPFNILNYSKWPDLSAAEGTFFVEFARESEKKSQSEISYEIDCHYLQNMWMVIRKTNLSCREALQKFFLEKVNIDNTVWALRLKIYYNYTNEQIMPLLAYSDSEKNRKDPFVSEVMKILDFPLDDRASWEKWKFRKLLNPHDASGFWKIDPRWISNSYKKVYIEKASRLFHMYPSTSCPLVCWFIIKRNELDNIRTASESLRLNVDPSSAMKGAGGLEVNNG